MAVARGSSRRRRTRSVASHRWALARGGSFGRGGTCWYSALPQVPRYGSVTSCDGEPPVITGPWPAQTARRYAGDKAVGMPAGGRSYRNGG